MTESLFMMNMRINRISARKTRRESFAEQPTATQNMTVFTFLVKNANKVLRVSLLIFLSPLKLGVHSWNKTRRLPHLTWYSVVFTRTEKVTLYTEVQQTRVRERRYLCMNFAKLKKLTVFLIFWLNMMLNDLINRYSDHFDHMFGGNWLSQHFDDQWLRPLYWKLY